MESNEILPTNISELDQLRAQKHVEASQVHRTEIDYQEFETTRRVEQVRFAGMVTRMVVTEPVDTDSHLDQPAIVIKHGFMASRPAYNGFANELARSGRRVIHYGMPRTSIPIHHYHPKNMTDALRAHSQVLNGVSVKINKLYPDSPSEHDYIGHSLGGRALSKFIEYKPEAARSAVLLASAGLKPHTFRQMARRAATATNEEIVPFIRNAPKEDRLEFAAHSLYHMVRNPLFLLREGYHAATDDALPSIRHARENGVKVAALWMTNDSFFPLHEVDDMVKAEFDAWRVIHGNHLAPQEYADNTAKEVLSLINTVTEKQQKLTTSPQSLA